jgi:4-amino-4-deoxy-L-arabinose transferase-like glycosyltransferase
MMVYVCYFLLLATILKYKPKQNLLLSAVIATLFLSTFIVTLTELLSYFKCLNLTFVSVSWSVLCLILIFLVLKNRAITLSVLNFNRNKINDFYKSLVYKEKIVIGTVVLFILLLFIQGIIYPPNNWDSLTYHMSRIMYWLSNESVAYYPTHILRHLYQPPFNEYFILNLNLLNGNDYLSNSVQLFFLVNVLFLVYSILEFFKAPRFLKMLAIVLVLTIPSVELQSTNTKNDIVCGFFIIATLYFSIKAISESSFKNYLFLGLSIGLGMLTKGTAYLFLIPILFCFGIAVLYKIGIKKKFKTFGYSLATILLILALNITHYSRNYSINHSFLNVDDIEAKGYSNEVMGSSFLFSNLLKNAGLHLGFPINKPSDYLIRFIHANMNISIDDKRLNYLKSPYEGARSGTTHEDYVPNTIPFFLTLIAFAVILISSYKNKFKNKKELVIVGIVIFQILLFAGYLKWQPWHTRLHIPIFILSVLVIVFAAQTSKIYQKLVFFCMPIVILSFLFYFVFNDLRPIITNSKFTKSIKITDNRFKKYFSNQQQLYIEYNDVIEDLYDVNPSKLGLNLNDWEYPLLNSYYYDHLKIVVINVSNITNSIPQDISNIDVIISNYNTPVFEYDGIKYTNQNSNHSYIWLYKKTN